MNLLRPLLADNTDVVKVIMFVVVLAIYAINHLLSGLKKPPAGQPPRMPPPLRPGEAAPRGAAEAPPSPARPDLNAELSEFLRRAAAKRQEALGRSPAPAQVPAKTEPARPRKRKKPDQPVAAARAVDERLTERRALPRLETSSIEARSGQLTQMAGDQLGDRVREAFDRQLGQLGAAAAAAVDKPAPVPGQSPATDPQASVVAELSALLYNPQSLRGVMILNEILVRPEHRW